MMILVVCTMMSLMMSSSSLYILACMHAGGQAGRQAKGDHHLDFGIFCVLCEQAIHPSIQPARSYIDGVCHVVYGTENDRLQSYKQC